MWYFDDVIGRERYKENEMLNECMKMISVYVSLLKNNILVYNYALTYKFIQI